MIKCLFHVRQIIKKHFSELSKNSKASCDPGPWGTAPHCPMVVTPLHSSMDEGMRNRLGDRTNHDKPGVDNWRPASLYLVRTIF
jgi:hypothetical protein